jgi:hypothetical protein
MPPAAGVVELLADLAAALAALRIPWYVFGAQAALIWGRPRLTTDVDVTIKLQGIDTGEVVRALSSHRITLRIEATVDFVRQTRVLPMQHEPSGLPLDLVLAGPGLEDAFLERAVRIDVSGTVVPFICAEDLIVTKILAGRTKDTDDVRGILEERGPRLDIGQIRETLRLIEDALGQSDLLPAFDAALRASGGR